GVMRRARLHDLIGIAIAFAIFAGCAPYPQPGSARREPARPDTSRAAIPVQSGVGGPSPDAVAVLGTIPEPLSESERVPAAEHRDGERARIRTLQGALEGLHRRIVGRRAARSRDRRRVRRIVPHLESKALSLGLLLFEDSGWRTLRPFTDVLPVTALAFGD